MSGAGQGPRVSIGVPVFNGEPYLAEALASLRAQTFEDVEIVISDNASTDATEEICREAAREDARVRYVRNRQNYGFVHNFNQVFTLSRAPLFTWAAADDVREPTYVERCVERLDADPSLVLVCPRAKAIDATGADTVGPLLPGPLVPNSDYDTYTNFDAPWSVADADPVVRYQRLMRDLWYTVQLYGVVRSDALARTGLHPRHRMGDHILLSELVLHGRFGEVEERLFLRRFHDRQVTRAGSLMERLALAQGDASRASPARLVWTYVDRLRLHAAGVRRAPLSDTERRRCLAVIARSTARWARHRLLPG